MYKYSLVNPVNWLSSKFMPILVLGLHSVTTTFTLTTFEVKPFFICSRLIWCLFLINKFSPFYVSVFCTINNICLAIALTKLIHSYWIRHAQQDRYQDQYVDRYRKLLYLKSINFRMFEHNCKIKKTLINYDKHSGPHSVHVDVDIIKSIVIATIKSS